MAEIDGTIEEKVYTLEDFLEKGQKVSIQVSGRYIVQKILGMSVLMQAAADMQGYSDDAGQALFLFVSEVSNNALKARGSYQLISRYGTFEDLLSKEDNALQIINDTVTNHYDETVVCLDWELAESSLRVQIANNSPLNDYLKGRIETALNKSPLISEQLIDEMMNHDNILDTKASGIGMGLSLASNFAAIAGGVLEYCSDQPGWTTFKLTLVK